MSKILVRTPDGFQVDSYRVPGPNEEFLGHLDSERRAIVLVPNLVPPEKIVIGEQVHFEDCKGAIKKGKLVGYLNGNYYSGLGGVFERIYVEGESSLYEVEVPDPPGYRAVSFDVPKRGESYISCDGIRVSLGCEADYYIIVKRHFTERDLNKKVHGTGSDAGVYGELVSIQNYSGQPDKVFYVVATPEGNRTCESIELDYENR